MNSPGLPIRDGGQVLAILSIEFDYQGSEMNKRARASRRDTLRLRHFDYATPRAYFITVCAKDGKPVFADRITAEKTLETLKKTRERNSYKIYAHCLMPDHLHLLLNPADSGAPVSRFLQTFKSQTAYWYKREHGMRLWQRGFYDHVVRKSEDLAKIAQYILSNPVRENLTENADDYPYSGMWDSIE
jgi:putative transposase